MKPKYCKQNCNGKDADGLCTSADCCEFFLWDVEREQGYKPQPQTVLTEAQEQEALFEWCRWRKIEMIHIPNERKCSVVVAAQLARQGMRKGFPDNFFPIASKGFHGLFIELKRAKKALSKKSPEQREWIKKLNEAGYKAVFCYGAEEAKKAVLEYIGRELNAESRTTARNTPILNDNISVDNLSIKEINRVGTQIKKRKRGKKNENGTRTD